MTSIEVIIRRIVREEIESAFRATGCQHSPDVTAEARWLSPQQAADYSGIARGTLDNWRSEGIGPSYVKVGRMIRFERSEVDSWLRKKLLAYS